MLRLILTTAATVCLSAQAVAQDTPETGSDKAPVKELKPLPADRDKVVVGMRAIKVPPPAGFARCDGINPDFDSALGAFLPAASRMVAYFASPEDLEALRNGTGGKHESSFNIQVIREVESREIGQATFAGIRDEIKQGLDASRANADAEVKKVIDQGKAKVKAQFGTETDLDVTSSAFVGYFEDSDTSLGFTMLLKSAEKNDAGEDVVSRTVVAAALVPVNGRLIGLYGNFPYEKEEDRTSAEKAVATWRDSLVEANPKVQGPVKNSFEKNLGTIVGGVLGVVIVAVVVNRLNSRKQAPPPPPSNYLNPQG